MSRPKGGAALNDIIKALLSELEADRLLPFGDPMKMSEKRRDKMWDRLTQLQLSKGQARADIMRLKANAAYSAKGKKLGRPKQNNTDAAPADSKASEFLDKLKGNGDGNQGTAATD